MYIKYFIIALYGDVVSYPYYCIMQKCSIWKWSIWKYGSIYECVEYYWSVCGVYACWSPASCI